jgi:hypothetical protein
MVPVYRLVFVPNLHHDPRAAAFGLTLHHAADCQAITRKRWKVVYDPLAGAPRAPLNLYSFFDRLMTELSMHKHVQSSCKFEPRQENPAK